MSRADASIVLLGINLISWSWIFVDLRGIFLKQTIHFSFTSSHKSGFYSGHDMSFR